MKIEMIQNNQENCRVEVKTDSLFHVYNFIDKMQDTEGSIIVSNNDIENVLKQNFISVKTKIVKVIFELTENETKEDGVYNFYICETGKIFVGENMKKIKENIKEIKESYKVFKNRKFYNSIKFEL